MSRINSEKSSSEKELIYIDGKDRTQDIESYTFFLNKYVVVYKGSSNTYNYSKNRIKLLKSSIKAKDPKNVFHYFKKITSVVGIMDNGDDKNILQDDYNRFSHVDKSSVLYNYLNSIKPKEISKASEISIYPFSFNLSQKEALDKAFSSSLSVIEGPPGTGKTQTILNIIANAIIKGQSVAVVSGNNSATKNVYEKLEKENISFIAALLGNFTNKKNFIDSQVDMPDISEFSLSFKEENNLKKENDSLFIKLTQNLTKKNNLALLKHEIENLKTEFKHFENTVTNSNKLYFKKSINSYSLLSLWIDIENKEKLEKRLDNWLQKLIYRFKYGIREISFFDLSHVEMIKIIKSSYYITKINELSREEKSLTNSLKSFSFKEKMQKHAEVSMKLFKNELFKKYNNEKRKRYTEIDLRFKSDEFISDYPVIMSTTYSLRRSLSEDTMYDFVIIDECSQVDLVTGALALSCAKKAIIVGDLKQLPNVVKEENKEKLASIFNSFSLPGFYNYAENSLLSSIMSVFPELPKTLLKEHYRCHPKIIDFCNIKFYNNQLIILSDTKESDNYPLIIYKTNPGNHARERVNQRQIDVIKEEVIPQQLLHGKDVGIVTPYRNQSEKLKTVFVDDEIVIDTVDKFQGRENEVIILSTVDNQISKFTDNSNRLNVAISRAIKQLILVVNSNENEKDTNISDLIKYIEYNEFLVVNSELYSIFDYLYKGYEERRREILSKNKKISNFDSENLMYNLILKVLTQDNFSKYDIITSFPLRDLILDFSKLTLEEEKYAKNYLTHLDFLIYNKLGKTPVLAIEVDGYAYHKSNSKQSLRDEMKNVILKKYNIPFLRFSTIGQGEEVQLINKLFEIQSNTTNDTI